MLSVVPTLAGLTPTAPAARQSMLSLNCVASSRPKACRTDQRALRRHAEKLIAGIQELFVGLTALSLR